MPAKKKANSFEEDLTRLEEIAAEMEESGLPLEKLCGLYEEGMKLSEALNKRLEAAYSVLKTVSGTEDGGFTETVLPVPEADQE